MMTRQHFQFIADTIREHRRDCFPSDEGRVAREADAMARRFARELHRTNSRFDEAKFLKACGVKE